MQGFEGGRGHVVRLAGSALVAAIAAGIVIGGVARLLMSAIAVAAAEESRFTPAGTLGVMVVFGVLAVPAAVTATARPLFRTAGRWVTALVTGLGMAVNGFADGAAVLLAPDGRATYIAVLTAAFGVTAVAHGMFTQDVARRLTGARNRANAHPPATGQVAEG
ncbi:hypothetical protein [Spongiactinospora sp. TRM90649]|uniref:hypothetical protein n=1 Tax=Spongiactinospora sp. TRM90649 TaxID=3031114 RepID=UPI0023F77BDA|nr:hypothetical protein [Spongiactinospora sp. TRM90649]MDF5754359.1 hypothetical protein [Spongiactinospora sp. TRM90649]